MLDLLVRSRRGHALLPQAAAVWPRLLCRWLYRQPDGVCIGLASRQIKDIRFAEPSIIDAELPDDTAEWEARLLNWHRRHFWLPFLVRSRTNPIAGRPGS